jgi:hypothetical protein
MNDYRLTFADEDAWWAAADAQGWVQYTTEPAENPEDPPIITGKYLYAQGVDFDVLGVVYVPAENPDDPPVALPGWGVNIRFNGGDLPDDMVANITLPSTPVRTFAGGWFQGPKVPPAPPAPPAEEP